MKKRWIVITTLFLILYLTIPKLFAPEYMFDIQITIEKLEESNIIVKGAFKDDIERILLNTSISFFVINIPFIYSKLPYMFKWLLFLVSSWFMLNTVYFLVNLKVPEIIFDLSQPFPLGARLISSFLISTNLVIFQKKWLNQHK